MGLLRRQLTSLFLLLARRGSLWLALLAALVLLGLLAAGCSYFRPTVDPYAELRQSWRPGHEMTTAELEALPAYSMTLRIDPTAENKAYTGTLDLTLPFTGSAPLYDLYFRTYPNLYAFGGKLQVTGAKVNDKTVNFGQAATGSAIRLSLPDALEPGTQASVQLSFEGNVGGESEPGTYTIFGANEDVLSLSNFYPILAARRGDEWVLDTPHPQGDVDFHDAALYRVEVTAPPDQIMVATGTEITRTLGADGWATTRYVIGPAREFAVLMSPHFQTAETETLGTRIRSYFRPEDADAGREVLRHAAAALQVYSDRYGPYPYRDMAIVEAPLTYHGMEFPGISLIGSLVYKRYRQDLEMLVVHEMAHQWWYNQVGSDQIMTPWLDEGLAEFSMYDYFAGRYGEPRADRFRELRWQLPLADLRRRGKDAPIGLPVRDYKENYETLVYGKGAEFFATLRDELGTATFDRLLRTYLERYRWRIATPAEFRALAEEVSGKDLGALFQEWVERKE